MKIRNCRVEDVDGVRKFVQGCKPLDLHSAVSYWVLFKYFSATCLVMEDRGKILGYVSGVASPDRPGVFFLWQIGVDPSLRGRGHAARLVKEATAAARTKGCDTVHVTIEPDNRASLKVFSRFAGKEGLSMTRIGAMEFSDALSGKVAFEDLYEIRLAAI